jgi:cytochrome P450
VAAPNTTGSIPGPAPTPLFGWRSRAMLFARDPLALLVEAYRRYGGISALVQGDPTIVFALGSEANRNLMSHPELWQSPEIPFNIGQPDGQYRQLAETHRDVTVRLAGQMVDRWGLGCQVDVDYVMRKLTLSIALRTLYGEDMDAATERICALAPRWVENRTAEAFPELPHARPWSKRHRFLHVADEWATALEAMIVRRRGLTSLAEGPRPALLDPLLRERDMSGAPLSGDQIIRRATTFVDAAYPVSVAVLTWTLVLLSQHPPVLADLQSELANVLGDEVPSLAQLAVLPALDRIVKESLRLFPPMSVGRCASNAAVELASYRLPAGATVVYSPYITHRQPELYLNPLRFRPERWLFVEPEPHEYLPFGAFTNVEWYTTFAVTEVKLILALVARRYSLTLAPGVRIDRSMGPPLTPRGTISMIIAPPDRPLTRRAPQGHIRNMLELP